MTLSQKKVKIKNACLEDAKAIFNVVRQAFIKYKEGKQNPHLQESLEDVKEDIKNNIVLVLKQEGEIVGTLRLVDKTDEKKSNEKKEQDKKMKKVGKQKQTEGVYLKKFAIAPGFQGQGFGTKLFKKAVNVARDHGYQKIWLHSSTENKRLVNFYQNLGFECIEINQDMGYERGLWMKDLS